MNGRDTREMLKAWSLRIGVVAGATVSLLVLLLVVLVAVRLPTAGDAVAVDARSATAFVKKSARAIERVEDGQSTDLTFTATEVTSFLALWSVLSRAAREPGVAESLDLEGLRNSKDSREVQAAEFWDKLRSSDNDYRFAFSRFSDFGALIERPEVRFTDSGRVIARGEAKFLFLSVPTQTVIEPLVKDGRLELDFVTGHAGRVPLPAQLFGLFDKGLEQALAAGQDYAHVEQVSVQEGSLRLVLDPG